MSMTINPANPNAIIDKLAAASGAEGKTSVPDAGAVERFQRVMAGGDSAPAAPTAVSGVAPEGRIGAEKLAQPESVGDRIIQGMSSLSEKVRTNQETVMATLDLQSASQADLLKAQFAMLQTANTIAAVSKVAEKTTQGIKTLQQGS